MRITGCISTRKPPPTQRAAIHRQMRDAFYVDVDDWKAEVYAQARDAALRALVPLATP